MAMESTELQLPLIYKSDILDYEAYPYGYVHTGRHST
jgi:hypothetical protein